MERGALVQNRSRLICPQVLYFILLLGGEHSIVGPSLPFVLAISFPMHFLLVLAISFPLHFSLLYPSPFSLPLFSSFPPLSLSHCRSFPYSLLLFWMCVCGPFNDDIYFPAFCYYLFIDQHYQTTCVCVRINWRVYIFRTPLRPSITEGD